eukprot:GEMP01086581.1.p1 GENE.GEMP01086581.1~~GEMP01086581.1.p1  ORF type:complete len:127 (+),score=3.31 GEMP01086581.1:55-435(+)
MAVSPTGLHCVRLSSIFVFYFPESRHDNLEQFFQSATLGYRQSVPTPTQRWRAQMWLFPQGYIYAPLPYVFFFVLPFCIAFDSQGTMAIGTISSLAPLGIHTQKCTPAMHSNGAPTWPFPQAYIYF